MKEIHIRSGVERLNLTAFTMLPVIETICLEGIDPNVIESDWVNLENSYRGVEPRRTVRRAGQ